MFEGRSIAVVVPAHNEEPHVADVISSLPEFVDRVYAIDDASADATWAEIQRAASQDDGGGSTRLEPRVVPIQHRDNRGAGGAVLTGYRRALEDGIDVVAVMDGDGQMDPADLDRIIIPVVRGDVAYAKGTRLLHRENRASMSRWRLFGNSLLTMLTRFASGYWEMSDPQNGYTAISAEALAQLPLDDLYDQYGFLNDVLVHLSLQGHQIADVSHRGLYGEEKSGIRYRRFVPGLSRLLLRRFVTRLQREYLVRQFHPLILCYGIGVLVLLTTTALVAGMFVGRGRRSGNVSSTLVLATLGMLSIVVGAQADVEHNGGRVSHYEHALSDERVPATTDVPERIPEHE